MPASPKGAPRFDQNPPCPRFICVPQLCDLGVCLLELSYDGEDPNTTGDHCEGVPLCHVLLAMQKVTRPVLCVSHHQGGPLVVTVKGELRATRPLVPDSPKHFCPVLPIECFPSINEEKPQFLFM